MKIDIRRLTADVRALEDHIRTLKAQLRTRWTEPMDGVQAQLHCAAAKATALYTLRAWARGRLHRTVPPRDLRDSARDIGIPLRWDAQEHNRKVARRVAPQYELEPDPRPLRTGETPVVAASPATS